MTRNTGKPSEQIFIDHWTSLGKIAYCRRLNDSAEINGRNKQPGKRTGRIKVPKQPSDFLVTFAGTMTYAEVKSTSGDGIKKSAFTDVQKGAARMQTAAMGLYTIYIHYLPGDRWYQVPGAFILNHPKSTVPWSDLQDYIWRPQCL